MPVGKPPKYKSADEMQIKIDEYFDVCNGKPFLDDNGNPAFSDKGIPLYITPPRPPTMCGLALYLGFASRQSLLDYKAKNSQYLDTITRAKSRVEEYAETRLYDRDGSRGAEFNLRTNFGWRESKDADSGNGIIEALIKGLSNGKDG